MSKRQDELIMQQQTYLDFCLAEEPYRRVAASDKVVARAELSQLLERAAAERLWREMVTNLRADLQAAQERSAEQERQIDDARHIMIGVVGFFDYRPARVWLSANPAPQEQP